MIRRFLAAGMMLMALGAMAQDAVLPAFPGAEGFGAVTTTGGRGGKVYHVTTLDDTSDEGSFRWACKQSGTRTIVFDVSGTIHLKSELKLNSGNVTIAGQTAPGDGICVADYPFVISAPNVIIRFMRFRLGNEALKTNPSAHEGDGLGGMDSKNIVIDHCSVSWSIDECLSVYGSHDITVQWCMITQSLVNSGHSKGAHGYGGNWGGAGASYHHNLLAHHGSRTPRLGPRPGTQLDERMDLRNNVIYNYGGNGCYGGENMTVNIVNNYYKPGPATPTGNTGKRIAAPGIRTVDYCKELDKTKSEYLNATGLEPKSFSMTVTENGDPIIRVGFREGRTQISYEYPIDLETNTYQVDSLTLKAYWNSWGVSLHKWGHYYLDGNYNSLYEEVNEDNWTYGLWNQISFGSSCDYVNPTEEQIHALTPMEFVATTTHSAEDAYERVLAYAGASLRRDVYDAMMVADTRDGVASCKVDGIGEGFINSQDEVVYADGSTGFPVLNATEAPADSDGDGMPDEYELANGLDPLNEEDGAAVAANGYTNLENYINGIVAHIVEAGNAGGVLLEGSQEFVNGETGSDSIHLDNNDNTDNIDNRTYNLMGVEVKGELMPGIYIRNGKKFVVR